MRTQFVDKGLLYGVECAVRGLQSFDGAYRTRPDAVRQCRAGVVGNPVDDDGASAAFAAITSNLGAGQSELVAQRVCKRFVRRDVDPTGLAIDVEGNQSFDGTARPVLGQGIVNA